MKPYLPVALLVLAALSGCAPPPPYAQYGCQQTASTIAGRGPSITCLQQNGVWVAAAAPPTVPAPAQPPPPPQVYVQPPPVVVLPPPVFPVYGPPYGYYGGGYYGGGYYGGW